MSAGRQRTTRGGRAEIRGLLAPNAFAFIVIAVAGLLRLVLIVAGWPASDSDESTMGIMALHIAARTDFPVFFYGQRYMGALEAYLAAGVFQLFGPSLVALRLGMALLATLWLVAMYLLGRALYTPWFAMFCCALLAVGPSEAVYRELWAGGGYGETLCASALLMALAARLAMTSSDTSSGSLAGIQPYRYRRLAGFAAWGLVAGLGVWSDTLVLPFALCAGLLLAAFCWREWRAAFPCLLAGLLIGALPLLIYAVSAPDHNPLAGAFAVQRSSDAWSGNVPALFFGQVVGTLFVALPTITGGSSLCALSTTASWPLANASAHTLLCTGMHGVFGVGYIALLVSSLVVTLRTVGRLRTSGDRATLSRESARLALLAAAALTVLLFASSPVAARSPAVVMRYLIGVLVALPALLAPLWSLAARIAPALARRASHEGIAHQPGARTAAWAGAPAIGQTLARAFAASPRVLRAVGAQWRKYAALAGLIVVVGAYIAGAATVAQAAPDARATNERQDALAAYLAERGITRVYSDYWTCGWLTFDSRERVICAVVDPQLRPGLDRFPLYGALVREDPAPAYVFALDSAQEATFEARLASSQGGAAYLRETVQGYVIYRSAAVPSAVLWPAAAE